MRARVVGLGLIGGSIGLALRRAGWRVSYFDPNVTVREAVASGAADEHGATAEEPDVTLLATPVDVAIEVLRQSSGLMTSVCSVMKPLRDAAGAKPFVAGHPLAGSAKRGLGAADGDLFRDRKWFVDRGEPTIERVIADCGARAILVDAEEHDAAVALTSHIPQILSTALAAYLGEQRAASGERELTEFAGPGLATFLRLAESDASLWVPTIEANRPNIQPHIDGVMRIVAEILAGNAEAFAKARDFMRTNERMSE